MSRALACALLLLGACAPDAAHRGQGDVAPPPEMAALYGKDCRWGEVRGADLSIWSYTCRPTMGSAKLVADPDLPGFKVREVAVDNATERDAVRIFEKPADAPIAAVLEAVRAASAGPATAECVFEPAPMMAADGKARFVLAPTGAAGEAWAARDASSKERPCGDLGVRKDSVRTFEVVEGAPGKIAMIDWGDGPQIYDPATLRAAE